MKKLEMDAVDQEQQRQIDTTRVWMKVVGMMVTLLVIFGIAIFAAFMEITTTGCPHTDCVHHKAK
jgi:hypothetical protein